MSDIIESIDGFEEINLTGSKNPETTSKVVDESDSLELDGLDLDETKPEGDKSPILETKIPETISEDDLNIDGLVDVKVSEPENIDINFEENELNLNDKEKEVSKETIVEPDISSTKSEDTSALDNLDLNDDLTIDQSALTSVEDKEPVYSLPTTVAQPEVKTKGKRGRPKKSENDVSVAPVVPPEIVNEIPPVVTETISPVTTVENCLTAGTQMPSDIHLPVENLTKQIVQIQGMSITSAIIDDPIINDNKKEEPEYSMFLDPIFDISKINPSLKYQTRAVKRSQEQLETFGKILQTQGQLEPIHLHKEGTEYFLVVGFGRYDSLKLIGSKSIKAIVHENLSDSEIIKLSNGTNEFRLQLTEWDKIMSVGQFHHHHPEIPKASEDKNSLVGIFGYSRASIYIYLDLYEYFKDKESFKKYFKETPLNQYVFKVLFDARANIDDEDGYVQFIKEHKDVSKREFEIKLATYIANERMIKSAINNPKSNPNSDPNYLNEDTKLSKDEIDINKMVNDITSKKDDSPEKIVAMNTVFELLNEINKSMKTTEDSFKKIMEIPNAKQYVGNAKLATFCKKIQLFSKMCMDLS